MGAAAASHWRKQIQLFISYCCARCVRCGHCVCFVCFVCCICRICRACRACAWLVGRHGESVKLSSLDRSVLWQRLLDHARAGDLLGCGSTQVNPFTLR